MASYMEAYQATIGGTMNPQKSTMSVLAQIASWIPDRIIDNLAIKHKNLDYTINPKARRF